MNAHTKTIFLLLAGLILFAGCATKLFGAEKSDPELKQKEQEQICEELISAIKYTCPKSKIEKYLEQCKDVNYQSKKDLYRGTALGWAANAGDVDLVDKLLTRCANVNIQDSCGRPPLIDAIIASNVSLDKRKKVIEKLLQHHPNLELCDVNGATTLMHAFVMGATEITQLLLDNGANIDGEIRCNCGSHQKHTMYDLLNYPIIDRNIRHDLSELTKKELKAQLDTQRHKLKDQSKNIGQEVADAIIAMPIPLTKIIGEYVSWDPFDGIHPLPSKSELVEQEMELKLKSS